jgi:hypothetical protein
MSDADDYREFAQHCLKLADETDSAPERKALLEMALAWSLVAEELGDCTAGRARESLTSSVRPQ